MNGTPKSHRAVELAAAHCTHPDINGTDKALLMYLAICSDHAKGTNSHPGNRNLTDVLCLTDSPTDARLRKNRERGLIARTERGDGRGKASAYRLCLESPYFPDFTPGGECLVVEKPPCPDGADSDSKPPRGDAETALPEHGNRPAE